jgi:hypothetical protein
MRRIASRSAGARYALKTILRRRSLGEANLLSLSLQPDMCAFELPQAFHFAAALPATAPLLHAHWKL